MLRSSRRIKAQESDSKPDSTPGINSTEVAKAKIELAESRRQNKLQVEKQAREGRLQKRKLMKDFNRVRAERKRDKKARRTKGAKYSGKLNTYFHIKPV